MTPWASSYFAPDGRLTVVDVAATDGWAEQVLTERPQVRLHRFAHHGTGAGDSDLRAGSLDRALAPLGIRHLNYVRIADAAIAMPVLLGASGLMQHARIDIIEIASDPVAARSMTSLGDLLVRFGFVLLPPGSTLNDLLLTPYDDPTATVALFALHSRFISAIEGRREPDLGALVAAHGVMPRGVIHVGAHTGDEVPGYLAIGFRHVLLIEADPTLAAGLADRFRDTAAVTVAACAVTDRDGTVDLRVMSATGSNSILAIKEHAEFFPTSAKPDEPAYPHGGSTACSPSRPGPASTSTSSCSTSRAPN